MALASIQVLIKGKLPFLTDDDNAFIDSTKEEVFFDYFVGQLSRPETDISDETLFTIDEALFLAEMTAYEMAIRIAASFKKKDTSSSSTVPKEIEKAKADVVEVTYKIISDEQAGRLYLSSKEVMNNLLMNLCARAGRIGVMVAYCAMLEPVHYDLPTYRAFE